MPETMPYPRMYGVRQLFETHRVTNVERALSESLARLAPERLPGRGERVAIAVGSRGIQDLDLVVRVLVRNLRDRGAQPVVVPAMGSHGGATAAGQAAVLEALGVSETALGVPVVAAMDTILVGETADGVPVHVGRTAATADRVVVVNRVKPHTLFSGVFESGLAKMLLVGLGNEVGASIMHRAALTLPFERLVRTGVPLVVERCRVAFGVAIVEDAGHEIAHVEAVAAEDILVREPALLAQARRWMPRLPLREIDLLIVDEMGKHLSGQGMDPSVTGRRQPPPSDGPRVTRLFVRDLGMGAHGNAHGIGQADVTTTRLVRAADWRVTWINSFASGNVAGGRIPPHFASDREAVDAALGTIGLRPPGAARIVRIRDTRSLDALECSEPCLDGLEDAGRVSIEAGPYALAFDDAGNLRPVGASAGSR